MGLSLLPRLLFADACLGLCLATAACTSSSAGTAGGVAATAVPSVGGSATATAALGASAAASPSTGAPSVPHYKNLPTGWKTFSSWDAKMVTMAGANAKVIDLPGGADDPGDRTVGRDWAAPGFRELAFSIGEDKNHTPITISCFADGYNAGNAEADSAIEELFRQCASADFPGAETTEPQQWIQETLANFFEKERKAPHASADPSIEEFGDGRYGIGAGYLPTYGLTIELNILGLAVHYSR